MVSASASRADYRAGVDAYRAGDFERALGEWLEVARQPPEETEPALRAETCFALAMLYWMGQGVPQDSTEAAGWLRQAADLNHAGAQSKLGYLYLIGQGVAQSDFEAFKLLSMAANAGDVDAQYNLGVMYRDGRGVEASQERALQWFGEAAAHGDRASAVILSEYQRTGDLTAANSEGRHRAAGGPPRDDTAEPTLAQRVATFEQHAKSRPGEPVGQNDWPPGVEHRRWIDSRDSARYTIQVIAVRDTEAVRAFIGEHPELHPFAVYSVTREAKPLWVLLQGDFPSLDVAQAARDRFPAGIQPRENLWIRPFAHIKADLHSATP